MGFCQTPTLGPPTVTRHQYIFVNFFWDPSFFLLIEYHYSHSFWPEIWLFKKNLAILSTASSNLKKSVSKFIKNHEEEKNWYFVLILTFLIKIKVILEKRHLKLSTKMQKPLSWFQIFHRNGAFLTQIFVQFCTFFQKDQILRNPKGLAQCELIGINV